MQKNILTIISLLLTVLCLTSCASTGSTQTTNSQQMNTASVDGTRQTWQQLQGKSSKKLKKLAEKSKDVNQIAWFKLALINKSSSNGRSLSQSLLDWRKEYPDHIANNLLPTSDQLERHLNIKPPQQIAVILPLSGKYGRLGKTVRSGFLSAYFANLANTKEQKVKFYDSNENSNLAQVYQQAQTEGADFIIGPLDKEQVSQISQLPTLDVPVLALNYTPDRQPKNNFYEFGLLPEDEARQMASHANNRGTTRALIIVEDSDWGKRMANAFGSEWSALGGNITETWHFNNKTNFSKEIAALLQSNPNAKKNEPDSVELATTENALREKPKSRRDDFDVVLLFANPKSAQTILPTLRFNFVTNTPVYASSSVHSIQHATKGLDLNGVTICDIPWQKLRKESSQAAKSRLYAVGKDAYTLSQSIQQLRELENFPLYGTTGVLTMLNNQQIHRHLPCRTVRNNRV